jgi:hypothetical protein
MQKELPIHRKPRIMVENLVKRELENHKSTPVRDSCEGCKRIVRSLWTRQKRQIWTNLLYGLFISTWRQGRYLRQILAKIKNRNLSRPISNLSRLNWSSERNSVHCFTKVFTLLQQEEVLSSCLPRDLLCLVFESSNTFLPMLDCGKLASNNLLLLF